MGVHLVDQRGAKRRYLGRAGAGGALVALLLAARTLTAQEVALTAPGADKELRRELSIASLVLQTGRSASATPQEFLSAARADYRRLMGTLYRAGYYSGVISIRIDGREAADIPLTDELPRIGTIDISVTPGPQFAFGAARMAPYAPGTRLPPPYRDGQPAYATAITAAAEAGVEGWRQLGFAKAEVVGEDIVADHATNRLDSTISLDAGPRLTFGDIHLTGADKMRPDRIVKIAGNPAGERYDPDELDDMASRLRRTGIFRSVVVTEAEEPNPDGTLDVDIAVVEDALRRFGFGGDISSADGLNLSAFWLHRNLFGGGEQLRFDGVVNGIGASFDTGTVLVGARIERPGTPTTGSMVFGEIFYETQEVLGLDVDSLTFGIGAERVFSDTLTVDASLSFVASKIEQSNFSQQYRNLAFPVSAEWDRRDSILDPTQGSYLDASLTPFLGFDSTGSGAQMLADARLYRGLGEDDRFVLAGRLQLGTVVGSALLDTPPDYLFYSGGGGTVRGFPYQSMGVTQQVSPGVTITTGGQSFAAVSAEFRARIADKFGAVVFYDAGFIGDDELWSGTGQWQTGAGIGARYDTGFGPVRLDLAMPISGPGADGLQVYIGIGQAF